MELSAAHGHKVSTRVAVVCPHALPRAGLCQLLETEGCQVVWQGSDGFDITQSLDGAFPDLILLAWDAPGVGTSLIGELHAASFAAHVVVMGPPDAQPELSEALEAGALGFLSCNLEGPEFLTAVTMLAQGNVVISHDMIPDPERPEMCLTAREREVLRALGRGLTNQEIAQELRLSPHTVKVHVHQILTKMAFRDRQQASVYAASEGIV